MIFRRTQPKFQFGTELELFTLDKNGYMVNAAPKFINTIKKNYIGMAIQKEVGKNMIEINSDPEAEVSNALENIIRQLEFILYTAEKENLVLYPYGTYPGSFTPQLNKDKKYQIKEKVFGKNRALHAARCIGLHCHFTLPWSTFDETKVLIRGLIPSRKKHTLINIYNLFIAMDPALSTFAQSSPFYQGKRMGKDARVIVYRGGKVLRNPQGVYANYPEFGALPHYKATAEDLLELVKARFETWTTIVRRFKINIRSIIEYGSLLSTSWNPIKINAHGTMEHRGMDANKPSVMVAIGLVIKYCAHAIQEGNMQVVVSREAIKNPFKIRGNAILIPPHKYVYSHLQVKAAYQGLEDDSIYTYCNNLFNFAKKVMPKSRHPLLNPIAEMLKKRETTSDEIIKKAKIIGYKKGKTLTNSQAAKLALMVSQDLYKDILTTKQNLKVIS